MHEKFSKWEVIDMAQDEGAVTVSVLLCKKDMLRMLSGLSTMCVLESSVGKSSTAKQNAK